jgi:hypothetical protein
MKKNKMIIISVLISVMLSACSQPGIVTNQHNKQNENKGDSSFNKETPNINKGFSTIVLDIPDNNYVKLKDISPDKVPEINLQIDKNININLDNNNNTSNLSNNNLVNMNPQIYYKVSKLSDGFVCASIESIITKDTETNIEDKKMLVIRKFDFDGKLLMKKEIKDENYEGSLNNIISLDNDDFIFSTNNYYEKDKNFLIKCNNQGKVIWKKQISTLGFDKLNDYFINDKNEIILTGLSYNNEDKTEEQWNILVAKLNMKGNIIKQKYFGGSDYEYIDKVKYNPNYGIVILGRTSSIDGDFGVSEKPEMPVDFVAFINDDMNLKWVNIDEKNINYEKLLLSDDEIIILGCIRFTSNSSNVHYIKYNTDGQITYESDEHNTTMYYNGNILNNGNFIFGKKSKNDNKDELLIYDKNNKLVKRIDNAIACNEIIPTTDGGFIIKAMREIDKVPQPVYISSIWYDREVVLVKFDGNYNMQWRKTYDKYKKSTTIDFVEVLEDSTVITDN